MCINKKIYVLIKYHVTNIHIVDKLSELNPINHVTW